MVTRQTVTPSTRSANRGDLIPPDFEGVSALLDSVGLNADPGYALNWGALAMGVDGAVRESTSSFERLLAYAEEKRLVEHQHTTRACLGWMALMRGDLAEIDRNAELLKRNPSFAARNVLTTRHVIAAEFDEALDALPPVEIAPLVPVFAASVHGVRTRVLSLAGRDSAAQAEYRLWREAIDTIGPLDGLGLLGRVILGEDFLPQLADRKFIQQVYEVLTSPKQAADYMTNYLGVGMHVVRGDLALHLDEVNDAESHYQKEIEVAEREGLPFSLGRAHQGLAEVAERRGDHPLAMQHLDTAGELFSQYGAKLYLDQVIAKKEILKA